MKTFTLQSPALGPGRIQLLDELRGFAILLILTYHICGVTGFPAMTHGELGVDIFVLLSGLSLAMSNRTDESGGLFLWRRFARLLPAYWVALTLFWLGGVFLLGRVHHWPEIVSHYLCIHQLWGDQYITSINDSFWFLSLITSLYVVFALLRPWMKRLDIVLGVGGLLTFLAAWVTYHYNQPSLFTHYGLRPGMFFIGLVFGVMFHEGKAEIRLTPWLGLGVAIAIYGLFVTGLLIGYNVAGFSLFIAYWAIRANADEAASRPLCRFLAWLGLYSYEIFLLHQPLIREYNFLVWQRYLGVPQPGPWQIALGVLVALAVTAWLSYELQNIAGMITRRLSPPKPATSA